MSPLVQVMAGLGAGAGAGVGAGALACPDIFKLREGLVVSRLSRRIELDL